MRMVIYRALYLSNNCVPFSEIVILQRVLIDIFFQAVNPNVALTFHWPNQRRTVRIEGRAQILPATEAAKFFGSRPLDVQITSLVSKQDTPLPDRAELWRQHIEMTKQYESGKTVPVPATW